MNDLTVETVMGIANEIGFSHVGLLNVAEMRFLPEVRAMCAADRCNRFGRCWTCPPYCGSLEEIQERVSHYTQGVLVQSTGEMEDDFDIECMTLTGQLQKERFNSLVERVRSEEPDCLPMSSGSCNICEQCTCPDAPCRFPTLAIPSMEAYGLFVTEVCKQSGMAYKYGPLTITYTSCILLK